MAGFVGFAGPTSVLWTTYNLSPYYVRSFRKPLVSLVSLVLLGFSDHPVAGFAGFAGPDSPLWTRPERL